MLFFLSAGAAILTLYFSFKMFFADSDDFFQCVKYHFIPDIWSMFKGRLFEDWDAEWRLHLWLFSGYGMGLLTFFGLGAIFA